MKPKDIFKLVDDEIGARPEAILDFLSAISESARETAEHISTNWQDEESARAWNGIADEIDEMKDRVQGDLPFEPPNPGDDPEEEDDEYDEDNPEDEEEDDEVLEESYGE